MTELERLTGSNRIPSDHTRYCNGRIVSLMSMYLNFMPRAITPEALEDVAASCNLPRERAYGECLAALCEVGTDRAEREFTAEYIVPMVRELDPSVFESDPYYQTVRFPTGKQGKWELKTMELAPCEAFVCNDFLVTRDNRMIPQIGFFMREFKFPGVLENGREWMTLMPNETVTTRPALDRAHGRVLTFGLGLGYFAYMAARKPEVESVTVVDLSADAIALFEKNLLPQMECRDKLRVVHADAFEFAKKHYPAGEFDFVFADIWHDVSDGKDLYLRFKSMETLAPDMEYTYWLENSIACYLNDALWP